MNKMYLIKVKDINDDRTIMEILDCGTIDETLDNLNIFIVTADECSISKLKTCHGVTRIEVDENLMNVMI